MKALTVVLMVCGIASGCAPTSEFDMALSRVQTVTPPPQLASSQVGGDRYADAAPDFAGVDVAPVVPEAAESTEAASSQAIKRGSVAELLNDQGQQINCNYLGDLVLEYSQLSEQQDGAAVIEKILDTRLLDDWSQNAEVPTSDEKVPLLRCWSRVRWSIGVSSDVDLWLLIDSDANVRVRWDNITNVDDGTSN